MRGKIGFDIILFVSFVIFCIISGFVETVEIIALGVLLFVFQASHYFVWHIITRFWVRYWIAMWVCYGLVFIRAANANSFWSFWIMWFLVLGVEIIVWGMVVYRFYRSSGKQLYGHLASNELEEYLKYAKEAIECVEKADLACFFSSLEKCLPEYTYYRYIFNLLRNEHLGNHMNVNFSQRCRTLARSIERLLVQVKIASFDTEKAEKYA